MYVKCTYIYEWRWPLTRWMWYDSAYFRFRLDIIKKAVSPLRVNTCGVFYFMASGPPHKLYTKREREARYFANITPLTIKSYVYFIVLQQTANLLPLASKTTSDLYSKTLAFRFDPFSMNTITYYFAFKN